MNKWAAWSMTIVFVTGISAITACFHAAVWVNPDMTNTAKWTASGMIPLIPLVMLAFILSFVWEDVGTSALEREVEDLREQRNHWRNLAKEKKSS